MIGRDAEPSAVDQLIEQLAFTLHNAGVRLTGQTQNFTQLVLTPASPRPVGLDGVIVAILSHSVGQRLTALESVERRIVTP